MKIALLGTSPYSVRLAPYGDKAWLMWGCSPGLYPIAPRLDAWFELHRWEPPTLGVPHMQVPWFTPEYCGWMAQRQHVVWMAQQLAAIPMSKALPVQDLVDKYGHYFFTSSLAWMAAMAIEAILLNRELLKAGDQNAFPPTVTGGVTEPDAIGFWGVDMSTEEEYIQQRSGCQFFATIAASMGIRVVVPPESDLLIPPALYGVGESSPRAVRSRARFDMMTQRKAEADQRLIAAHRDQAFMDGQMDAEKYHIRTWTHEGECKGTRFEDIFGKPVLEAPQPAQPEPQPEPTPKEDIDPARIAGVTHPGLDPEKIAALAAQGLTRSCSPNWCRVKVGEECVCIVPIEVPADGPAR